MEYVILDIETTGLDIEHSSILEVGAVLIKNGKILKEFSSLVQYGGEISDEIKRLTGISEEMVRDASLPQAAISGLEDFIKGYPVVAHNGFSFDFPILERYGVKFKEKYDSLEFAFFVFPISPLGWSTRALVEKYKLGSVPHRALADCKIEFEILKKLEEEFGKRKKRKKEFLKYIAEMTGWWWWFNFLLGKSSGDGSFSDLVEEYKPYRKENVEQEVLGFATEEIDFKDVKRFFIPEEMLEKNLNSDYIEDRPEQQEMAKYVTDAFNLKNFVVVEAGTGTGKSKAYLVPSLLFAQKNKIPIIVSTHTKILQDQLFLKEIDHLREIINPDLKVAVLKGKKNYICVQKFEEFSTEVMSRLSQRSLYEFSQHGAKFSTSLAHLLLASWIIETERGDWDEIPQWIKSKVPKSIEHEICNFDELCGPRTCDLYAIGKCFFAKARNRAKDADLVIVNHAVMLSGFVLGAERWHHTVFPNEARFIIIDEAHYLEDDATSAFSHDISKASLEFLMQLLYGNKGVNKLIVSLVKSSGKKTVLSLSENYEKKERDIRITIQNLFESIVPALFLKKTDDKFTSYRVIDKIPDEDEEKKIFLDSIKYLGSQFEEVEAILGALNDYVSSEKIRDIFSNRRAFIKKIIKSLGVLSIQTEEYVRYLEEKDGNTNIVASPISVAEKLRDIPYNYFNSIVFTSATITVDKSFSFFINRCGTSLIPKEKIKYHLLSSSFDYKKQVRFYVPKDITYSSRAKEKHFKESAEFLENAILASDGGSLILCSSFTQVQDLYEFLVKPLAKKNILLLRQQRGASSSSVISEFKNDINSVLIGTETFWQGVDIPGNSLRSLFIFKIPYRMPGIPIIEARREKIDKNGGDSFNEYYEPLTALLIKQGFGRLIRKSTDRGVAVLLDENLIKKGGILNSLPDGVSPKLAEHEEIYKALKELNTTDTN